MIYNSNAYGGQDFPAPLHPGDVGEYEFNWTDWLNDGGATVPTRTISSETVTAVDSTKLTITNVVEASGVITFDVTSGADAVAGTRYGVECEITDSDGNVQTRTGFIYVANR